MSGLTARDNAELRRLLQDAVVQCTERCLYQSAKWAAELLNSLPALDLTSPTDTEVNSPISETGRDRPDAFNSAFAQNDDLEEARLESAEVNKYLLAKSYFNCREFDRCAAVFMPATLPKGSIPTPKPPSKLDKDPQSTKSAIDSAEEAAMSDGYSHLSQKALFLALYSKYLSGEKRKDESSEQILGPADSAAAINYELVGISHILETRFAKQMERGIKSQGWLEYLYGIVLAKGKNEDQARAWLIRSVNLYPFNWGAWQELCALLGSTDELGKVVTLLKPQMMTFVFHVYANQELFQVSGQILQQLKKLKSIFPKSSFLRAQKALLYYHAKDFEKADHVFSKIVAADPLRIDDLDVYSNILYVMEKRPMLGFLAQLSTTVDGFRPETCCVVGNYYALKSEHEKAVVYFRRALMLDRNFLSAWTLMGHEYVELKNTQAAIECYRRAVDVNRRDFRAWYGLGQTYEVLEMSFYALFYYQRAAALSPYDPKMWAAVGSCLGKMNRPAQSIQAYKRALVASTQSEVGGTGVYGQRGPKNDAASLMDPDVLFAIAQMYDKLGNREEVRSYLQLTLEQEDGPDADDVLNVSSSGSVLGAASSTRSQGVGVTGTTSKARLWLAKMEFATGTGESFKRALELANELCQDGYEVEEAKALIRDVRAKLAFDTDDD